MTLEEDEDTGVLVQIGAEEVGYYPDGTPMIMYFPLDFDYPPKPGTLEHQEAIAPYVHALIFAFAPGPQDIDF